MKRLLLSVLLMLAGAGPLRAQTNDHFFRSWSWGREEGDTRAAALGGAALALTDDSVLARVNPAGLTTMSRGEVSAHLLRRGSGTSVSGDRLSGGSTLGSLTACVRLRPGLTAGFYATDTRHARIVLEPRALPDERVDEGQLDVRVREAGISIGTELTPRLQWGVRIGLGYASISGEYRRETPGQLTWLRVGTGGSDARLTGAMSAAWTPASRLRLAATLERGNAWSLERTATSAWLDATLDAGSRYRLRQPSAARAGAALRVSRKLNAFVQLDRVRYSEIQSTLVIRHGAHSRDDYFLADAWEPRGGLELSVPFRTSSLQFRAGIERAAPGALVYQGGDPVEQATFKGARSRVSWTGGAALVTGSFRMDTALRMGGERTALLAGLNVRF